MRAHLHFRYSFLFVCAFFSIRFEFPCHFLELFVYLSLFSVAHDSRSVAKAFTVLCFRLVSWNEIDYAQRIAMFAHFLHFLFLVVDQQSQRLYALHLLVVLAALVIIPFDDVAESIGNIRIRDQSRVVDVVCDDDGRIQTSEIKRNDIFVQPRFGWEHVRADVPLIVLRFVSFRFDDDVVVPAILVNLRKYALLLSSDDKIKHGNIARRSHLGQPCPRVCFAKETSNESRIDHAIFARNAYSFSSVFRVHFRFIFDAIFVAFEQFFRGQIFLSAAAQKMFGHGVELVVVELVIAFDERQQIDDDASFPVDELKLLGAVRGRFPLDFF